MWQLAKIIRSDSIPETSGNLIWVRAERPRMEPSWDVVHGEISDREVVESCLNDLGQAIMVVCDGELERYPTFAEDDEVEIIDFREWIRACGSTIIPYDKPKRGNNGQAP